MSFDLDVPLKGNRMKWHLKYLFSADVQWSSEHIPVDDLIARGGCKRPIVSVEIAHDLWVVEREEVSQGNVVKVVLHII